MGTRLDQEIGGITVKVLVLHGSPKGEASNTLKLTKAFLEGLAPDETEILDLYKLDVRECRGCFACWNKTPGVCVIHDDMASVIQKILAADVIVWSFPLYYFSLPSRVKMVMDRLLPMSLPFMTGDASGGHPRRYDMGDKRYVVISTCGFYTAQGNYDTVDLLFTRLYGNGYGRIYCGQGELFRVKELSARTSQYLEAVRTAGAEFARGGITQGTQARLAELLYPREVFEQMADASWGVSDDGAKVSPAISFTRQMAALYNPATWKKDIILQMDYTDEDVSVQIVLTKDGQRVVTDDFLPYTTCIRTPLSVWQSIARGEISGTQALMEHRYTVDGDFDTMLRWDELFGPTEADTGVDGGSAQSKTDAMSVSDGRRTNMNIMLLPWIVCFIAIPIDTWIGGIVSILLAAVMPLLFLKWKPTVYDCATIPLVIAAGLVSLMGVSARFVVPGSYLAFGIMWFSSVFCKLPLSAHYSMNQYGYEKALSNALFIVTNRILSCCWGVLYLLTPIWTYVLMGGPIASYTGLINSVLPALMGIFTVWFQKWYPAYYART